MEKNPENLLITWKVAPLQTPSTFNQSDIIKTIPIQNLLLFFKEGTRDPQQTVAVFDLKGKRWPETQWNGPSLTIEKHSSICQYKNNSVVILTMVENKETLLSILTLNIGLNGIIIDNNVISLQDKLLRSFHSANIFDERMYLYGGKDDGKVSNELCSIDLKTLAIKRNCSSSGQKPGINSEEVCLTRALGEIWGHKSVSIKNKIYIYGGYVDGGLASKMSAKSSQIPNENIYTLDIGKMKWEKFQPGSRIYGAAQIYEDNIFFFGGTEEIDHNYLSVFNTSENLWYQVSGKGDAPKPGNNFISVVNGKEMVVLDVSETQGKQSCLISHSFNMEIASKEINKRQEVNFEASEKSENNSENLEKQETFLTTFIFFIFSFFEAFKKSNEKLKESGSESSLLKKITSGLTFWLEEMIGSWFNRKFPGFYLCRKRMKKLKTGEYFLEIPTRVGDWMQSCIRRKINFWANSALSSAQDSMKEMDPEVSLDIMIVLRGYMNQIVDFVVEFILGIPAKIFNMMKSLAKEAIFSCCRRKNQKRGKRE